MHPARHPLTETPASAGLAYQDVKFNATDGVPLRGWFIPAPHSRGVIIFRHGYPGIRSDGLHFVEFLRRAGFSTLIFDFRGLGQSGGAMCTIGYQEPRDAVGAVRYLHQRPDTGRQPLGIFGFSMGAAVAIMTAAQEPSIKAVVADCPYASLDDAVRQHFVGFGTLGALLFPPTRWFGERMIGHSVADVSPLSVVARIAPRPLLLIHGTADDTIPPRDSQLLYDAAGQPKQLWLVPGAAHVGAHRVRPGEYERRVSRFFADALMLSREDAGHR